LSFADIFDIRKLESLAIVWRCLRDTFECFSLSYLLTLEHQLVTDRHTDRHTATAIIPR